jgi:alpha-L-rhamnosidase
MFLVNSTTLFSQQSFTGQVPIAQKMLENLWDAKWITATEGLYNLQGEGFFLFKKHFQLSKIPKAFVIHVSADNRYRLYVNGKFTGQGPAQGTMNNWQFDTYDIAEYLQPGENVISSEVWQWGDKKPWTQLSHRTALVMQGNGDEEAIINTDQTWFVLKCDAVSFFNVPKDEFPLTTGVGPGERWDMKYYPFGWNYHGASFKGFIPATSLNRAQPAYLQKNSYEWQLYPRRIPFLESKETRFTKLIRREGSIEGKFIKGRKTTVPSRNKAVILIEHDRLTNGYPILKVSQGKNSKIKITYAEALVDNDFQKADRNQTKGMGCKGLYDIFIPDGGENRTFKPLWYRTFRFVKLEIETAAEPLIIHDFNFLFDAYPFELKSSFECSDAMLNKVFSTGWWTARMCASDIYMDCPYYERLQYFFDIAVSSPVTSMLSGDVRLLRNAIIYGYDSMQGGDHIMCAYPDQNIGKIIPFFSIAWIDLIYNYLEQTGNIDEVEQWKVGIFKIMSWYTAQLNSNYLLGPMPYWNFVDCNNEWPWDPANGRICEPTGAKTGNSALLTLQFVYGLERSAAILDFIGDREIAAAYDNLVDRIKQAVSHLCFDSEKKYFAETPENNVFSQHTNILAVLTGCIEGDEARELIQRLIQDKDLLQMSTQFQNFYHKALLKVDLQDNYTKLLDQWKELIRLGFTTFPEYPNLQTRSDCHMWNAFPAYDFIKIVCGIRPKGFGLKEFEIQPALGKLDWVKGSLYHPAGNIRIEVFNDNGKYSGTVFVPNSVKAELRLPDKIIPLISGKPVKF